MQKAAASTLQTITANRLSDGIVVFLGSHDRWVERISEARVFEGAEAIAAAEAVGEAANRARIILGPYAIDVTTGPRGPVPIRFREKIRAFGPTARTDVVPQAFDASVAA
jgi:hypothetical protein